MDDGQKTPPRGHLDFDSYVKFLRVFIFQKDERTDRRRNTLASRGLEEPAHASRGLEELFLQLCSFWFWQEIGWESYHTVVVLC